MNKDTKQAVKQLMQSGALTLIEEVIKEIKETIPAPQFTGNSDQLAYDTGKYNGIIDTFELLKENLTDIAKDV